MKLLSSSGGALDRQIDLNALMIFYEVINAGSMTAASAKLNIAKSSISRRLSRLEEQFGSTLLNKRSRRLTPTELGETLYQRCQKIAAELQAVSSEAAAEKSIMKGPLRVSVQSDFGIHWFANLIADFVQLWPQLTLTIQINSNPVDLTEAGFDIAIQVGELRKPSQLICRRLAALRQAVYASPQYIALHGTPQSPADCGRHDWIVTDVQQREGVWLFRKRSEQQAVRVAHKIVVNSARLARELAIKGLGITLIPEIFGAHAVAEERLVRVLVPWQTPTLQVTALFLPKDKISKRARTYLEFFAERINDWQAKIAFPDRSPGNLVDATILPPEARK